MCNHLAYADVAVITLKSSSVMKKKDTVLYCNLREEKSYYNTNDSNL